MTDGKKHYHAADDLAKAFLKEGREWEASDAGRQLKNETAQQLIGTVRAHVEGNATKYHIPPQKPYFTLDVGSVPYLDDIEEWLKNKRYVAFEQDVGKTLDWLRE